MSIAEGYLKGAFKGFRNRESIFEFVGQSRTWRQAEYKYLYHYAYRPAAMVIQDGGRLLLRVEGLSETVEVRPA